MKQTREGDDTETTVTYMEDGRIDRIRERNQDGTYDYEKIFIYGNGGPYFTMVFHERVSSNQDRDTVIYDYGEEVDDVVVTEKDGLLQETVNNGIYANWGSDIEKEWVRFNGFYTAEYDEDGILSKTSGVFHFWPSGDVYRFVLTTEDGRITEVIREDWNGGSEDGEGSWQPEAKYEVTYTDTAISPQRYAGMINSHIIGGDNTYYIYSWY